MPGRILRFVCHLLIGGTILALSHADAGAASIESIEIKKREITGKSVQYSVDYSGCRFFINVDLLSVFDSPEMLLIDMDIAMPCSESLTVQMAIFRKMLEHVVAERPDIRKAYAGGLPSFDFSEEFAANIARRAYASKQWRKVVAGKRRGASVNKETLELLKESSTYGEFIAIFAKQGIAIELVDVEKAFLVRVSDVASQDAKHQDLSDLPKAFLVPGGGLVRFKVIADDE